MGEKEKKEKKDVEVEARGDRLFVRFLWRGEKIVYAVIFIVVNAVLFMFNAEHWVCVFEKGLECYDYFYGFAISTGLSLVCYLLLYVAAAYIINRTEITFSRKGADYRISGLPWPGAGLVAGENITGTYISEHEIYWEHGGGSTYRYTVYLTRKRGMKRVYGEFSDRGEAEDLAQQVRAALGLGESG